MATIINSDADLQIYKDEHHYRIFAGPGAGKTHLIIENIKSIVEHSKQIKNGIKKVLCITYTNAAVNEIKQRLGSYSKYVVVSTIHSFINEFIFSQFQLQLKAQILKEFSITVPPKTHIHSQQEVMTTLSGKPLEEIYAYIKKNYPEIPEEEYNELSKKKMTDVIIDISPVNKVDSVGNEKVKIKAGNTSVAVTKAIKDYTWSVAGNLSFDEVLYFGWKLVSEYELITHILRVEFPYIMLDEYQDTNPLQNLIVKKISEKGVIVTVVGDIAQSIYSFQGASYFDFKCFSLPSNLPVYDYVINGNRRSTENIIKLLNFIRQKDNTLSIQECIKNKESNELITFIIQKNKSHSVKPIREIIGTETKVLCRKWDEAFGYVSDITDDQKKLLNSISNAYTYQLSRDLFTEVEAKRETWIDLACTFLDCEKAYRLKSLPMFLDIIERYVNTDVLFSAFNPEKAEQINKLIEFWEELFSENTDTVLLKDFAIIANSKLKSLGLEVLEELKYPSVGEDDYFEPIYKYIDKLTYQTAKIIVGEIFVENSNYMTIHRSKGKEFDSVLVNGEPFAKERNFASIMNVICNPVIFSEIGAENSALEEYTRVLYVGFSRAKNKLYIHLFGNEETENKIRKSLTAYYKDDPPFYNFIYC